MSNNKLSSVHTLLFGNGGYFTWGSEEPLPYFSLSGHLNRRVLFLSENLYFLLYKINPGTIKNIPPITKNIELKLSHDITPLLFRLGTKHAWLPTNRFFLKIGCTDPF